jgi:hypothetical protein
MPPSQANAYVHLLAAVKAPTPAKNRIPRMRKSNPNPPPADPVAILGTIPIGCPLATLRRRLMSDRTKRIDRDQIDDSRGFCISY